MGADCRAAARPQAGRHRLDIRAWAEPQRTVLGCLRCAGHLTSPAEEQGKRSRDYQPKLVCKLGPESLNQTHKNCLESSREEQMFSKGDDEDRICTKSEREVKGITHPRHEVRTWWQISLVGADPCTGPMRKVLSARGQHWALSCRQWEIIASNAFFKENS